LTSGATALVGAVGSAVQAAADYQKLGFQTAAVLKSTGNAANTSVEGIQKLASNLESLSGVDEALIINSENVLATFTKVTNGVGAGNDVFDQATKAALNMSSALGTDLQGSTIQIGKALNDPVKGITALSRAGVSFTEQQKEQIKTMTKSGDTLGAQKLILKELNTEFGGAAEAAGKGFAGSMARLKDSVSDATRDIATKFLPTITNIADGLSMLVKGDLGGFTNKMKEIGDQAKEFGINVITKLKESWPMIKAEFIKWGTAAITWISEAIPKFYEKYSEFVLALFARITETLPGLLDKVAKWRDAFVAWVPVAITKLLENVSKLGAKLSEWISLHGADLVADLVQWAIAFAGFALKSLPGLLLNLGKVIIAIGKWIVTDGVPMLLNLALDLGVAIIKGLLDGVAKSSKGLTDKFAEIFDNIKGKFSDIWSNMGDSVKNAFIAVGNIVKGFFNTYIGFFNHIIDQLNKIHVTLPSALGGGSFGVNLDHIPMLAQGGIVNSPTIAMIGESGPEAIVPLSKMDSMGSGLVVNITVQGSVVQERDLAVTVRDNIAQLMRRRGLNPSILGV